ncbi:unnamed protein product [Nippostrongylus brasiliensis]|uniref:28S ribosomal protein S27, mitochondrial n=1 Tax=Nippostrongylus brasiliensis TaxID=27835 RepID=A0A0N4Y8U1_NIPBR|nr:unnamed protein product [Nippostrongylus brasiliensis]
MWPSRLVLTACRLPRSVCRRHLLSEAFALEKEWASRHTELAKLGLGGDYEWISAVQKKFIGGGLASAIDVDAAVCVAEHKDQVDDVIELLYKLRHSENAADLPASAEYALIRLLLRHDPTFLFKLADDPINYGVFMNEHAACLAIDYFIRRKDFGGAARLAAWVMQQEMTDNELLNLLALYSCSKWAELPAEEQTMPREEVEEEEEINEDDVKTFKFPFLKNAHFDSHFDLTDPRHLAGKTLLWIARDSRILPEPLQRSLRLLGAVLYNKMELASTLASSSIHGGVADIVRLQLRPAEGEEIQEPQKGILEKLEGCKPADSPVSSAVLSILEEVRLKEEQGLISHQVKDFKYWHQRRQELIKAQADRLLLKVRAEEIEKELVQLEHHEEKLSFFENRLKWEKRAAQNAEIAEQTAEKAVAS